MVAAYHDGSLSKTAYRERRARLLEAVTRGRPLRQSVAPREEPAAAVAWALPAGALLVLLALIAIGWWLLH